MAPADFKLGTYRHYKGDLYTAIGLVTHHHTRQPMVLYVSHAKACVNCRPLHGWWWTGDGGTTDGADDRDGFCDPVTMIDGTSVPRFELMQEATP